LILYLTTKAKETIILIKHNLNLDKKPGYKAGSGKLDAGSFFCQSIDNSVNYQMMLFADKKPYVKFLIIYFK